MVFINNTFLIGVIIGLVLLVGGIAAAAVLIPSSGGGSHAKTLTGEGPPTKYSN
jgi:hypothetical protein